MNDHLKPRVRTRPEQLTGPTGQASEDGSGPVPDAESQPSKVRVRTRPQAAPAEPGKVRVRTRSQVISETTASGQPASPPADRAAIDDRGRGGEGVKSLRAVFMTDDRSRIFMGARCELPTGEVVEVRREPPFYNLARELDARGYADWNLEIYTPEGQRSMSGRIADLAEWTVEESSRRGLRLRRYRPYPWGGRLAERRERNLGVQVPVGP